MFRIFFCLMICFSAFTQLTAQIDHEGVYKGSLCQSQLLQHILQEDRNTTAATPSCDFFGPFCKSPLVITQTEEITIQVIDGVLCHIGWYSDGYVITALKGVDIGKQFIVLNGTIINASSEIDTYLEGFNHHYSWGMVESCLNKQVIMSVPQTIPEKEAGGSESAAMEDILSPTCTEE